MVFMKEPVVVEANLLFFFPKSRELWLCIGNGFFDLLRAMIINLQNHPHNCQKSSCF
jgi:hypothetical protein